MLLSLRSHAQPGPPPHHLHVGTTSHLATIKTAYDKGDELALVLEDDVTIPKYFATVVEHVIATAPPGWEIVQFAPKSASESSATEQLSFDEKSSVKTQVNEGFYGLKLAG